LYLIQDHQIYGFLAKNAGLQLVFYMIPINQQSQVLIKKIILNLKSNMAVEVWKDLFLMILLMLMEWKSKTLTLEKQLL